MSSEDDFVGFDSGSGEDDTHQELIAMGLGIHDPDKEFINDKGGLEQALMEFKLPEEFGWIEKVDVVSADPVDIENPDDDFNRELILYNQALEAVKEARRRLDDLGIPHKRPEDYFAQMMKSDDQMHKIRQRLLNKNAAIESAEQRTRIRNQKKMGKQIEAQRVQEKNIAKRDHLDSIAEWRKSRKRRNNEMDDEFPVALLDAEAGLARPKRNKDGKPNAKRQKKNETYGFGGKKRGTKRGTQDSSRDMRGFSVRQNKELPAGVKGKAGKGGKKTKKRPGKAQRRKNG